MTTSKMKLVLIAALLPAAMSFSPGQGRCGPSALRLKVVFDNLSFSPEFTSAWGFSCVIEGMAKKILFDTGADGDILLANMAKMGVSPKTIEAVFLSHGHQDHTGGLRAFLQRHPQVTVYLPSSLPASFHQEIGAFGAGLLPVSRPERLFDRVYSSGEGGTGIKEHSLVLDTPLGLVIITGCAHQGIVQLVGKVKNRLQKEVYLLMGGFHLEGQPARELQRVGEELQKLGVKKVAPSHCTGEAARKLFRHLWGPNFINSGVGAVIELKPPE